MQNRIAVVAGLVLAVIFVAYSSIFVVNQRQQAIVIRFGQIQDVKTEPGIYFKLPFAFMDADRVQFVSNQQLRLDLDNMRVQVSGGKFYEVDAFVVYSITNARLFREIVSGDRDSAESRLRTRLDSALRRVYGLRGFEAALSNERASMMREVRDDITKDAGIPRPDHHRCPHPPHDLTKEVSQQTFDRMKAERLAEAEAIRARGNEGAQRRKAVADRGYVEILAAAQREAEILRGEGDAERNRIFGTAYNKDPEFFAFYRSMRSYLAAMSESDTTLVISPQSDFFAISNPRRCRKPTSRPSKPPDGQQGQAAGDHHPRPFFMGKGAGLHRPP